jgi:hypothetical protein
MTAAAVKSATINSFCAMLLPCSAALTYPKIRCRPMHMYSRLHHRQINVIHIRSMASSSSNDIKIPSPALKSWESGARRVKNVNGENNTYMDHIRDLHDPSLHIKTIEDELKGAIGKALGKQADKILMSLRLMDQERKRYDELLLSFNNHNRHHDDSSSNNNNVVEQLDPDSEDKIRQCAVRYNEYRKQCIQRRWELIVHRQAVGFIVGNHQFVMDKFPIPDALPVDAGTLGASSTTEQQQKKKKFGDQLDWWQKVGRWK